MSVVTLSNTVSHAERVEYVGPRQGSTADNPVEDADRELAAGRFESALSLYKLAIDQGLLDRHAYREAGRAAHALLKFQLAIDYLTRADEMSPRPDPELLYLLGEAQWATGRFDLAKAIHERALTVIGTPRERLEKLWVARMEGRLGRLTKADAVYDDLTTASPTDSEAALAQAEMHISAADWQGAERVVRRLLRAVPRQPRALAMLAWILEAQGQLDAEIELRKTLANESDHVESLRDYGRALERAGDWAAARDAYRRAAALPDGAKDIELAKAFDRVDQKMSVEVAAGAIGRTDPGASALAGFAGVALPFGRASQFVLGGLHEYATNAGSDVYAGELRFSGVFRSGDAAVIAGGRVGLIQVRPDGNSMLQKLDVFAPGAFVGASSGLLADHWTVTIDGELGTIWRESPRAVFEGGRTNGATGHLYFNGLDQRLTVDTGLQARQLELTADMGSPQANQLLVWGGADVLAWSNFKREARGQILDDELLRPTFAADSAVISYRHYELLGDTDPAFARRLTLADRASIDEVSITLRKVFARGALAVEGRGGFGRDWARELYLGRGSVALWISPTPRSRLSLSFDVARESVRALVGERRTGWMNYHVDL